MLAAWGWRSAGVAVYNVGGPLQPQLESPARAADADDAGRVGLSAGVAAVAHDAGGPLQPQFVSPADDVGRVMILVSLCTTSCVPGKGS